MVLDAVSNFVRGNTDAAVGTDDTTVSVADASIFPDPATDGEFNVVIWDANNFPRPDQDSDVEIMRVTARDTDTNELTVTRAQEMTSAATHPEGSAIHLSPTAKMFSDIESTFGDFWDAGTQELTADVNNTNTTTTALEAEAVSTDDLDIGGRDASETGWNHDGSHDFGSDGDTYNLSGEYDLIKIEVANPTNDASSANLRVNGDDGNNYDYWSLDGTRESGDDKIPLTPDNRDGSDGVIYMSGRWAAPDDNGTFNFFVGLGVDDGNVARSGKNSNVETPLESITNTTSGSNMLIDVYGKNPGQ